MTIRNTVAEQVLKNLRAHAEGGMNDKWGMIYLDNARKGMNDKVFRANLAVLSKLGYYKVVDGYAWGEVKLSDD